MLANLAANETSSQKKKRGRKKIHSRETKRVQQDKKNIKEKERRRECNVYFELLYMVLNQSLDYNRLQRTEILKQCITEIWNLRQHCRLLSQTLDDHGLQRPHPTRYILNSHEYLQKLVSTKVGKTSKGTVRTRAKLKSGADADAHEEIGPVELENICVPEAEIDRRYSASFAPWPLPMTPKDIPYSASSTSSSFSGRKRLLDTKSCGSQAHVSATKRRRTNDSSGATLCGALPPAMFGGGPGLSIDTAALPPPPSLSSFLSAPIGGRLSDKLTRSLKVDTGPDNTSNGLLSRAKSDGMMVQPTWAGGMKASGEGAGLTEGILRKMHWDAQYPQTAPHTYYPGHPSDMSMLSPTIGDSTTATPKTNTTGGQNGEHSTSTGFLDDDDVKMTDTQIENIFAHSPPPIDGVFSSNHSPFGFGPLDDAFGQFPQGKLEDMF